MLLITFNTFPLIIYIHFSFIPICLYNLLFIHLQVIKSDLITIKYSNLKLLL